MICQWVWESMQKTAQWTVFLHRGNTVLRLLIPAAALTKFVQRKDDQTNQPHHHHAADHAIEHNGQGFEKCLEINVEIHCVTILSIALQQVFDHFDHKAAGDDRTNLAGHVCACRVHEQEVLRIFLQAHFMDDAG